MELPQDPWELLGLDQATASERDVKRAYARLIKAHRPDTAPAEFQQVHEAYQYALEWLRSQREDEVPALPVTVEDQAAAGNVIDNKGDASRVEMAFLAEFKLAEQELEAGIRNGHHTVISAAFAKLRNVTKQNAELLEVWERSLLGLFGDDPGALGQLMDVEDVFRLLCYDHSDLANVVLLQWHDQGLSLRLAQLGTKCTSQKPPLDAPGVVVLQMRLAMLVAFINLPIANRLTNMFYPKLPPQVRDWVMPMVENRISAAKLFETLPLETRRWWEARIFPLDDATQEWSIDVVGPKLREILLRCPSSWPGYTLLRQVVPAPVFDEVTQKFRPALSRSGSSGGTRSLPTRREEKDYSWVWPCVLALYFMIQFAAHCSTKESAPQLEKLGPMYENYKDYKKIDPTIFKFDQLPEKPKRPTKPGPPGPYRLPESN